MSELLHWRPVRRGRTRRSLEEASLVLTAVEIDNRIEPDEFDWRLVVHEARASEAVRHLEQYGLENQHTDAPPLEIPQVDSGWPGVIGFLAVIWLVPTLQGELAFNWNWLSEGRLEASAVTGGEWWRAVTALTLHGDIGHIVGNSLFGAVFGLFVGRFLGSGVGWLLILLAGVLGNLMNAWLRPEDFRSIGASTATFAALAIGGAFVYQRGYFANRIRGWRRSLAPIFAGVALLSFTGVGGENTDVLAHFTGFGAGLGLGLLAARLRMDEVGPAGQWLCGAATLGLVALSWSLAGAA
jgi:membrane associated rhomboid family serine protease